MEKVMMKIPVKMLEFWVRKRMEKMNGRVGFLFPLFFKEGR